MTRVLTLGTSSRGACAAVLLALVIAIVEAAVGDDWAAVAEAIRSRLAELGITQKQLVARSGVSESTIRQLMNNYGPRQRNRHTLEDISKGLNQSADYLNRILHGVAADRQPDLVDDLRADVAELRVQVANLADRVDTLTDTVARLESDRPA